MSKLHTPQSGGYVDAKGQFKKAIMVVGSTSERVSAYVYLANVQSIVDELLAKQQLPGWNTHDVEIIGGMAQNIAPIHRGGRNRDITSSQLMKFVRAFVKIKHALKTYYNENLSLNPYFKPDNFEDEEPQLSGQAVKKSMDEQRATTKDQEWLKQNPDLITDNLPVYKEKWFDYYKKQKNKRKTRH